MGSESRPDASAPGRHPGRPASIRDVAELAGVSPGTASKALNQRGALRPETVRRVMAASERLAYRPNELVRGIFGPRSFTVGLVSTDSFGRFSGPVMAGAEDALGSGEVSVIMCDSRGDAEREQRHLATLLGRRIDGLIVTGRCSNPRPPISTSLPFPVVYAHTPSTDPRDCSVMVDDHGAGRLAAEHLAAVGRRHVAHITGPRDFDAVTRRAAGLAEGLGEHGLELVGGARMGDWSEAWGRQGASQALAEHLDLDAIYCGSDLIARGVIDALTEAGISVPDDVAVVGTDNWALIARAARPPLTTVDMRLGEVGRRAARFLIDAIDGQRISGRHVAPAELVMRASSGMPYLDPDADAPRSYHDFCIHEPPGTTRGGRPGSR
ncbi:MAG TPA: LacI family DNA-binding transcriptional regulator [Solirubrobacteraceae bacterium]|nr:LacI family DNA-binding transcriptional regulator [Solirubrobacteraceae bacterium]